jgi:hypothetical protein
MGFFEAIDERIRLLETIPQAVSDCVVKEQNTLLQLNKDTMLLGRDNQDNPIRPTYMGNPFWQSKKNPLAAARAYQNLKQRMRPETRLLIQYLYDEPEKSRDTPDLFIDGSRTQYPMKIIIHGDGFDIVNNDSHAQEMEQTHGGHIYGLSPIAIRYFWNNFLCNYLQRHLKGK